MEANELLKTLIEEVRELARTETVVGEQITVGSNTVIPISRIMVGFGGGSGTGELFERVPDLVERMAAKRGESGDAKAD